MFSSLTTRGKPPLFQQALWVVVLQHFIGPLGGGQFIIAQPGGQIDWETAAEVAAGVAFLAVPFLLFAFLVLAFLAVASGVTAVASGVALGVAVTGATASPAQAGKEIKAANSISCIIFFMVSLPCGYKYSQPALLPYQDNLNLAYNNRPVLKRGFNLSISVY